jgi:DNA repair exonuclease SbcCD ATPase subunit
MTFLAAPEEKGGVIDPAAADAAAKLEAEKANADQPLDYKAKLLALLGLDANADDAAIEAKVTEVQGTLTKVPELETAAAGANDASTKLQEANAELERVRAEYQALFDRDQAAQKQKAEAEVDAILEQFADRLTDAKAQARIRAILVSDREAGMEILNGLPAAAAASSGEEKKKDAPPAPKHDPGAETTLSAAEKAAEADKLIAAIRAEGKFKDYTPAREEARRRKPELFS